MEYGPDKFKREFSVAVEWGMYSERTEAEINRGIKSAIRKMVSQIEFQLQR